MCVQLHILIFFLFNINFIEKYGNISQFFWKNYLQNNLTSYIIIRHAYECV